MPSPLEREKHNCPKHTAPPAHEETPALGLKKRGAYLSGSSAFVAVTITNAAHNLRSLSGERKNFTSAKKGPSSFRRNKPACARTHGRIECGECASSAGGKTNGRRHFGVAGGSEG